MENLEASPAKVFGQALCVPGYFLPESSGPLSFLLLHPLAPKAALVLIPIHHCFPESFMLVDPTKASFAFASPSPYD